MLILLSHGVQGNDMAPGALGTSHAAIRRGNEGVAFSSLQVLSHDSTTLVHHFLQFPKLWTSRTDNLDILL